jgi:hypothetical protein
VRVSSSLAYLALPWLPNFAGIEEDTVNAVETAKKLRCWRRNPQQRKRDVLNPSTSLSN